MFSAFCSSNSNHVFNSSSLTCFRSIPRDCFSFVCSTSLNSSRVGSVKKLLGRRHLCFLDCLSSDQSPPPSRLLQSYVMQYAPCVRGASACRQVLSMKWAGFRTPLPTVLKQAMPNHGLLGVTLDKRARL